jgi:hypothetical protein
VTGGPYPNSSRSTGGPYPKSFYEGVGGGAKRKSRSEA